MVAKEHGGHRGFVDTFGDVSRAEKLAVDYIDSVLEFTNKRSMASASRGQTYDVFIVITGCVNKKKPI